MNFANIFDQLCSTDQWNLLYTALIFIISYAYGISTTLYSSALVDLSYIYGVDSNQMSYLNMPSTVGYLIGSLASFLYRWINRQLALTFFVVLITIGNVTLPYCHYLWIALIVSLVGGLGNGGFDSGYSIWLVELWPKRNAAILQASLFVAGIGSITGPLIASPFVYGEANATRDNQTITNDMRIRNLAVPFAIDGIALIIGPIFFLILFFVHRYEIPSNLLSNPLNSNENPKNSLMNPSTIPCRRIKILLVGLFAAFYLATESAYFVYSTSMWQYLEIELSASEAAYILSILSGAYTAGRLITAFVVLKVRPDVVILYHYAIIIGSLVLLYFGRHNVKLIYVGNVILGFGFSAVWASIFAFTEQHLRLSDKICSLYSFLTGFVGLITPLVLGQISFKTYPKILFFIETAFLSLSFVFFITVRIWIGFKSTQQQKLSVKADNKI